MKPVRCASRLALCLSLLLMMGTQYGRLQAQVDLSPPVAISGEPGETILMPLILSKAETDSIEAFGLKLFFPDSLLDFILIRSEGTLTENWLSVGAKENTPGELTVGGFNLTAVDTSGVLVNLLFQIKENVQGFDSLRAGRFSDDLEDATTRDGLFFINGTNTAPFLIAVADTSILEDEAFQLQAQASDAQGDTLNFSLTRGPAWLTIDSATGLLTGVPTNDDLGESIVVIQVDDGKSASVETQFLIEVINVNDPPNPFALLSPENGDSLNTTDLALTWETSVDVDPEDGVTYRMLVSSQSDFADTLFYESGLSETTLQLENLDRDKTYFWRVVAEDMSSAATANAADFSFTIKALPVSVSEGEGALPTEFSLAQNYPNPFNPKTTIAFSLPKSGETQLVIYDLKGQEVTRLIDGAMAAGNHKTVFDARGIASGVYFYKLIAGDFIQTKKLILTK